MAQEKKKVLKKQGWEGWYCWNCNKVVEVEEGEYECPLCKCAGSLIHLNDIEEVQTIAQDLKEWTERELGNAVFGK